MKKFFTAMLALVATTAFAPAASAQEDEELGYFDCFVNGEKVKNGDRIDITQFYEEKSAEPVGVYGRQYNTHLVVVPYVADEMYVEVGNFTNATPLDDNWEFGANLDVQFCGLDGQCQNVSVGKTTSKSAEVKPDEELDMQTEIIVGQFGDAADGDVTKLAISSEFTMTIQLDEQETVLTFYIDQKGIDAAVEGISVDNDATPVYYDLQGRQVQNPTNGLYIVKTGSKVSKTFIR